MHIHTPCRRTGARSRTPLIRMRRRSSARPTRRPRLQSRSTSVTATSRGQILGTSLTRRTSTCAPRSRGCARAARGCSWSPRLATTLPCSASAAGSSDRRRAARRSPSSTSAHATACARSPCSRTPTSSSGPHMVHCPHTVHLPLGALLVTCTMGGYGSTGPHRRDERLLHLRIRARQGLDGRRLRTADCGAG